MQTVRYGSKSQMQQGVTSIQQREQEKLLTLNLKDFVIRMSEVLQYLMRLQQTTSIKGQRLHDNPIPDKSPAGIQPGKRERQGQNQRPGHSSSR